MHDDWNKYTEAGNYDGPASGVGLKLWYGYDGDSPITVSDDLGDPFDSGRGERIWIGQLQEDHC